MANIKNVYEFSDLLSHARNMGYSWNEAHVFLVKDDIPPMYETRKKIYELEYLKTDYSWSEDTLKVMKDFMETKDVNEITII